MKASTPAGRLLALALCGVTTAAPAAPLSFDAALRLAVSSSPTLAEQDARIEAARKQIVFAGELPDPRLVIGMTNQPINTDDAFKPSRDPMSMQILGVKQDVPNADKRRARTEIARGTLERAEAERQIEKLRVRRETALAWIARQTAERKLALFDELFRENALLLEAVKRRIGSGQGLALESVPPRQEAARLEARQDRLEREQREAVAALERWIGPAAREPLAGDVPDWPIEPERLAHRLHMHPELAAFSPMLHEAEARVREARADKKPDWGVDLTLQRRPDRSEMASLVFSFDLPVFAAHRQDPRIAARSAELTGIEAAREAAEREHARMLEADLAAYRQLDRALRRQTDTLLPLAQEKNELTLAAYRAGQSDLTHVISARAEWIDARIEAIDLAGRRASAAARLHYAYEGNAQ